MEPKHQSLNDAIRQKAGRGLVVTVETNQEQPPAPAGINSNAGSGTGGAMPKGKADMNKLIRGQR